MKVSEFLSRDDIPAFLLGAFFGRFEITSEGQYIYTYSSYKNGKIYNNSELCRQSKIDYIEQLNAICQNYPHWTAGTRLFPRTDIVFALENDLHLNKIQFFNRLNSKILTTAFIEVEEFNEDKKMFIRGFSELRASLDRNRRLLTMDYVYNTNQQAKRVRMLIDNMNVPVSIVNYNFREFQEDYINGIERKTQLRFNINWYATNIGFINNYRIAVFENNFLYTSKTKIDGITYFECVQPLESDNINFERRLAYYTNNVLGRTLTSADRENFRNIFGINDNETGFRRNMTLANFVRYGTEDRCVCCCDDYDISARSHIERNTGRYHFEIHHMISLGRTAELDVEDNLAKICPACHALLGRGSAEETTQKNCIRKIFSHKPNILEFCKSYFDTDDYETVVDKVWRALR
jgi:hypothetical protein